MGTSVSHNEARKGDLCVYELVCVDAFFFFFLSAHTVYALSERLPARELVS